MPKKTAYIIGQPVPEFIIDAFIQAAVTLDLQAKFIDVANLQVKIAADDSRLIYKGTEIDLPDIIVGVAEKYEKLHSLFPIVFPNVRNLNQSSLIKYPVLADKRLQTAIFNSCDVSIPTSFYSYGLDSTNPPVLPIIAKVLDDQKSFSGEGVTKVFELSYLEKMYQTNGKSNLLIQEFVETEKDSAVDYRTLFIGGKHYSVKRVSESGKYKTNSSMNQSAFKPPQEVVESLNRLMLFLGLEFAAFDYALDTKGSLKLYEVNRFPYFGKLQAVHDVDIAFEVMQLLIS